MTRLFPARVRLLARAWNHALGLAIHALPVLVAACLPPDPFELVEEADDELPRGECRAYYEKVEEGRWQLQSGIWGSSTTTQPGELAAAQIEIRLNDWTSEHLLDMRLELEVTAGQALPGQVLVLRDGSEALQEVTFEGTHGNVAHFELELSRELCGAACTLSLSGPPARTDVPVPLKLNGTLIASVDATRKTHPCYDNELTVVVTDAP